MPEKRNDYDYKNAINDILKIHHDLEFGVEENG